MRKIVPGMHPDGIGKRKAQHRGIGPRGHYIGSAGIRRRTGGKFETQRHKRYETIGFGSLEIQGRRLNADIHLNERRRSVVREGRIIDINLHRRILCTGTTDQKTE